MITKIILKIRIITIIMNIIPNITIITFMIISTI